MKNLRTKLFLLLLVFLFSTAADAQMFWNHAVNFAGNTNSYLRVRPTSFINITGSFTLEAWVHPTFNSSNMVIMSKGSACSYGLKLSSRRPTVVTNNISRLTSPVGSALPLNEWSHVAATYNAGTNQFTIYINGVHDTSNVSASPPPANTDSLFIGKQSTFTYWGMMDDIRVWNRSLSSTEIRTNYRTFMNILNAESSPVYSSLMLSLTFNNSFSLGNPYNLIDWTNNNNPIFSSNITEVSLTDQLYTTISPNQSLVFDGDGDYAATPTHSNIEVDGQFTMEAWIYIKNHSGVTQRIFSKGTSLSSGYRMFVSSGGGIVAAVNSSGLGTSVPLPLRTWTHIAFSQSSTGVSKLYINGVQQITSTLGLAVNNTDSLFIGGHPTGESFNGYIDEIRISKIEKTAQQIRDFMYTSIDRSNDLAGVEVVYNFDGGLSPSAETGPNVILRKDVKFSNPNSTNYTPVSPLLRYDAGNFPKGYRMKTVNKRLPETGTSGSIFDSIYVNSNTTISDVNIFLAINHSYDGDIEATVFAPNGDSARICFDRFTTSQQAGDIIGIFDDQADSSFVNGRYTSFMPRIKPEQNFNSIFGGDNPQGIWRLKVNDDASGDTGMVYAWGIQLNGEVLVGVEDPENNTIPNKFELQQNYPNPFNPSTAIKFSIPKNLNVNLKVYDLAGREVASLINKELNAGSYEYLFDGSKLSSGVYFYKLTAGDFVDTKKMILIK